MKAVRVALPGMLLLFAVIAHAQVLQTSRVQFPGFTIDLPPGIVVENEGARATGSQVRLIAKDQYAAIPHVIEPRVDVMWSPDPLSFSDFRDKVLPRLVAHPAAGAEQAHVLKELQLDEANWIAVVGPETSPIGIGQRNCGPRFEITVMLRLQAAVEPLVDDTIKLLRSIRCGSEAGNYVSPHAAVNFPDGFGRVEDPTQQLFRSKYEIVSITSTPGDQFEDMDSWLRTVTAAMELQFDRQILAESSHVLRIAERRDFRPAQLIRVDVPGQPRPTYVGALHCEGARLTFLALIHLSKANDALAEQRLSQIGCPGDKGVDPPPFSEVRAEACRKGDARACQSPSETGN